MKWSQVGEEGAEGTEESSCDCEAQDGRHQLVDVELKAGELLRSAPDMIGRPDHCL